MRQAIICGGGIAGLGAAIGLARNGWSVDVYESSPTIREIGAGIFVKGNALRVLESFGVIDAIRGDCVALAEARTLDREAGCCSGACCATRPRSGTSSASC